MLAVMSHVGRRCHVKLVGTIPVTEVEAAFDTHDLVKAVAQFRREHPGVRVEEIDGVLVRGICACGMPVMQDTEGYRYDTDKKQHVCPSCNERSRV